MHTQNAGNSLIVTVTHLINMFVAEGWIWELKFRLYKDYNTHHGSICSKTSDALPQIMSVASDEHGGVVLS